MAKSTKYRGLKRVPLWAFLTVLLFLTIYNIAFAGRVFPNTQVAGVGVGGMERNEAITSLKSTVSSPATIVLEDNSREFEISVKSIDFSYDFEGSIDRAFYYDRTGNIFYDLYERTIAIFLPRSFGLALNIHEAKLKGSLLDIAKEISEEPLYPTVKLVKGEVAVSSGKAGSSLDLKRLRIKIGESLAKNETAPIAIPLITIDPTLSKDEVEKLYERSSNLVGKSLTVTFEFQVFTYKGNELLKLLEPKGGYSEESVNEVVEDIANDANRDPQNPTFVFENGRVNEFAPAKEGVKTKIDEVKAKILESLARLEGEEVKEVSFELPVEKTASNIQTADVNNLGIKELIGRGVSHFAHSIPSRVYNVGLAASRINGNLIKPGETFSFNDALGDVSKLTGYKEAFIIKDGKTVLGDGGGVCQVSTTLFRAALNAGLPIVERRAHAYRVGYYEQDSPPGLDATVYSPSTDLKILNDTPGYILIQATTYPKTTTLIFELYGTSDGRIASTTKPRVSDVVPAPEDLYQDDPTLPAGKVKQVDFKANGAKVIFDYKVERDGETIYTKKFISNYRPWQAVYLRGTAPQ